MKIAHYHVNGYFDAVDKFFYCLRDHKNLPPLHENDHFEDGKHTKQEPWRLPSRQAEFNGTDRLGLDARSDYQAVASNKGYFELKLN